MPAPSQAREKQHCEGSREGRRKRTEGGRKVGERCIVALARAASEEAL